MNVRLIMYKINSIYLCLVCLIINSCSTANYGGTEESVKIYPNSLPFLGTQQDSLEAGKKHCNKYNKDTKFVRSNRFLNYDLYKCIVRGD